MGSKLFDLIRMGRCSHEFSWPRRWPDGDYYQVCLLCGEEYRYDWKTMSRQERIASPRPAEQLLRRSGAVVRQGRGRARKKLSWRPRARRIKLQNQEIEFRAAGTEAWFRGAIQNISQTGILFYSEQPLAENTEIEMVLLMPKEVSGQDHSRVICRGMVVRTEAPAKAKDRHAIAAGIWDYKFLASDQNPSAPDSK